MRAVLCLFLAARLSAQVLGPPAPGESLAPAELPEAWTREQLIAQALANHPALAMARSDVDEATAMLEAARARLRPMLSATGWATYGDGGMIVSGAGSVQPTPLRMMPAGPALDGNLMLMWPLYTGGRLEQQRAAQRQAVRASEADLETMRLEIAYLVSALYRRILLAEAMVEVYRGLEAAHTERLENDRLALDQGKIPEFYVYRDEAALAEATQAVTNAERDVRVLTAELRELLAIDPLAELRLAPADEPAAWLPTRAESLDLALARRPELSAARARVAAARHGERAAAGAFQPEIGVFGMADLFANRGPRWEEYLGGVSISLPLLDGGMRRAELDAARARRAQLDAREVELSLQVAKEVVVADEMRLAADQNVATAATVLRSAREDYRITLTRYENQKSINLEVLEALASRIRAEVNTVQAAYELGLALDQLRRAVADPALLGQ